MEKSQFSFSHLLNEQEMREFQNLKYKIVEEMPQNINENKFLLIRHANSEYNYQALMYRIEHKVGDNNPEAKNYRLKKDLIDAPLHKFGVYQASEASQIINLIDFEFIFCSPLLRTLQTTKFLFQNYKSHNQKKLQVVVFPIITECIYTICDFSIETFSKVKDQFISDENLDFDWTLMDSFKLKEFWQLEMFQNIQSLNSVKFLEEQYNQYPPEQQIDGLVEALGEVFPGQIEDNEQIFNRSVLAQQFVLDYVQKNYAETDKNKQIAIVSHHTLLKNFIATGFNQQKQLENYVNLDNCQLYPINIARKK